MKLSSITITTTSYTETIKIPSSETPKEIEKEIVKETPKVKMDKSNTIDNHKTQMWIKSFWYNNYVEIAKNGGNLRDASNLKTQEYHPCLMIAVEYGNVDDVIFFLNRLKAIKKLSDKTIERAYYKAVEHNQLPVLKIITDKCRINKQIISNGMNIAHENNIGDMIKYFKSIGID